jgi:ketosteroid isomerase-like protein
LQGEKKKMKRFTQISIVLIVIAAGAFSALAQSSSDKIGAQIMKLETEYAEASKKLNAADFDRLETEDFMVTARVPARIVTKAEYEARLRDPNFKRGTIDSLINDDVKVRVYNETTAISTGHWKRVSRDADGKDTSLSGRFTHVWVKQNGRWLLAAAHYSPEIDLEKLRSDQTETKKND